VFGLRAALARLIGASAWLARETALLWVLS